jgi:hypothetical protein
MRRLPLGVPDTIRTYDLQLRRLALYPAELRARAFCYTTLSTADQTAQNLGFYR